MAFSTSNVKRESIGSLWLTVGDFTASAGDADGSVVVAGGRVYSAHFYDQNETTPAANPLPVKVSTSGNLSTITVNCSGGVSTGRFAVTHK